MNLTGEFMHEQKTLYNILNPIKICFNSSNRKYLYEIQHFRKRWHFLRPNVFLQEHTQQHGQLLLLLLLFHRSVHQAGCDIIISFFLSLSHILTHTHSAERFYFHLADFWRRIREEEEGGGSRRSWEQQRERQVADEQITQLISSFITSWIHKKQANVDVSSLWGEGDGVWRESAECLPAAVAARITLHSGNTTLLLFIFCRVRTPSWYHVFRSVLVLSGEFQSQAVKPFFWHTSMLVRKWWCQSILICIRDQISDYL